jgi:hypothetical protein
MNVFISISIFIKLLYKGLIINALQQSSHDNCGLIDSENPGTKFNFDSSIILLFVMSICALPAVVSAEDSFYETLKGGKVDFSLRYRYEHVDDDAAGKAADASTIRTTLGYTTTEFHNVAARILFQDVRDVGIDDFNDATGRSNAKTQYAVVADPSDTDILEGFLSFSGIPDTTARLGRQIITFRKAPFHRFMGTVLWRQNWQNHDAVSVQNKSLPDTTISYAYSWNVNRIFTENAIGARSNFDSDSHFINVKYNGLPFGTLEAYAYLLDFENAAALSVDTFGVRFSGGHKITGNTKLIYAAEYAAQDDAGDNPGDINADYFLGEIGAKFKIGNTIDSITVKFDYELLEGKGGVDRFITPLATGHAYQGWADRFLITPGDGIEDFYFTAIVSFSGAKFIASYHDINSDNMGYDYGEEIDLLLTRTFKKHYTLGLKYSNYDADSNATNIVRNGAGSSVSNDVQKFWAFVQIKF